MLKNWIHNLIAGISRRKLEKKLRQSQVYKNYKIEFNNETGEITLNGDNPRFIYPVDIWIPPKSDVD